MGWDGGEGLMPSVQVNLNPDLYQEWIKIESGKRSELVQRLLRKEWGMENS